MTRTVVASLLVAAALVSVASGASGQPRPRLGVSPAAGYPTTRFAISFTAPVRTGRTGSRLVHYTVTANASCGRRASVQVTRALKGQRVHVRLRPSQGSWCLGQVKGRLEEIDGFVCTSICAGPAILPRTLARFSFRVLAPSSDITPPSFGGVQRAVQCFPGAVTPGEQRPVSLSWNAASDNVSPSSKITYEIYTASTSGGENFSQPSWTTVGATSFTTPNLPGGRYFVVRARDEAGNQDRNTMERQAENPCL